MQDNVAAYKMKGVKPLLFLSKIADEMTGDIYRDKYNGRIF